MVKAPQTWLYGLVACLHPRSTQCGWIAVHRSKAARGRASSGSAFAYPKPDGPYGLTPRELEVLRLVSEGASNQANAKRLSLSERTVENHIWHLLNELGLVKCC